MKPKFIKLISLLVLPVAILACNVLTPRLEDPHPTFTPGLPEPNVTIEWTALPNNSGIEGVQTFPDRLEYHSHAEVIDVPDGDLPPVFGVHFDGWQNCGIYDQPIELGNAFHSMEHGAVWLTYRSDLPEEQVAELQKLVSGHGYVLMSPYAPQKSDGVLTAWGIQLVIDSLPDERITPFIAFYENGPQNPEPGAPCSGAVGTPIQ